ncbi:MAG: cytochrome c oxidase subunit 3 [Sphingobacteriales bacterium]|nr:cytochrome c oxidase subunit 3 [Sphingobacteriales bacterium]OJY91411.1 MAG: cytochrome oxidase subunit III [Sphingobacteriales bacterium 44-15]
MSEAMSVQRKKIHPYKFNLWLGLAGIIMMFAGLTSAYIVKRSQPGWESFKLPGIFLYSTIVILISSVTVQIAVRAFREREMPRYRLFFAITGILGVVFMIMQVVGFYTFQSLGMKMIGMGSNAAYSFVLAIAGLHIVHVLGGVIALIIIFFKAFSSKKRNYDIIPVEIVATYWHFVDILWVYLFIFFSLLH